MAAQSKPALQGGKNAAINIEKHHCVFHVYFNPHQSRAGHSFLYPNKEIQSSLFCRVAVHFWLIQNGKSINVPGDA